MGERAPALAGGAPAGWANLVASVRAAVRDPRRLALVVLAAALLGVSCAAPPSQADVIDSVPFSIGFFATLLTGEAVIFALTFSASSAWPSLREIDRHIAFREWVVTGWLGAMLTASGLLAGAQIPAAYGALLFLLADAFGMFSFIRLFGLASAGGRKRLLCRTLGEGLAEVGAGADVAPRMAGHRVVSAYLGQLDEAAARSDGNGVRDLADQLAQARGPGSGQPYFVLHLEVVHRLAKAALVGKLDPVVASSAAEMLIGSLLGRLANATAAESDSDAGGQLAAAVMGQASRYLAWLGRTSLVLSARQVTAAGAARELVAFTVRARQQIRRRADPDPPYLMGAEDLGTPLAGPVGVLAWIADFTEFHGAYQAEGMYPVYEMLTGTKFLGNYWDGDSVLSGLRNALFPVGIARAGPGTDLACSAFGSAAQFDRIWTLISVGAIATLRDPRLAHPPELIRPEFDPDPQLLCAYVRTFASHRYFTTADQAMSALITTISQTGRDGDLWHRVKAVRAGSGWIAPVPFIEHYRRQPACVLAIASRLAPLSADEPDRQLRTFLAKLPSSILDAVARLAARTLPISAGAETRDPASLVIDGLRVLQLAEAPQAGAS
jgi:hypothetical protein